MTDTSATTRVSSRQPSAGRTALIDITMLGGFQIAIDGATVPAAALSRRDPVRLASFLALARAQRVHREQLVEALWPDTSFDTVWNRLHKAAHFLRRATDHADSVVLANETISFFPNAVVDTDVSRFERLAADGLASGDARIMHRAVEMYTGDLLSHDPYEDWIEPIRHRLRERLRELLRATSQFDRLLALDPTDEHGHVGAMRAMSAIGDRSGVLRQFEQLRSVLATEFGVDPGREATMLRDLALGLTDAPEHDAPFIPTSLSLAHGVPPTVSSTASSAARATFCFPRHAYTRCRTHRR